MSFSKNININIKSCRRGISAIRNYHTSSSNTVESPKMHTRATMSVTQWKVLNQLKDYFNKLSNDKTLQNAINKEFAMLLQKFQPSVYGNEIIRGFESAGTVDKALEKVDQTKTEVNKEESSYMLPNILNGLKMKMSSKDGEKTKEVVPKWKVETVVSKNSINSRTRHIIFSIATAESEESKLNRIEALTKHIDQYPEAKHKAVEEGAINLLLRLRSKSQNTDITNAAFQALTMLGYNDPLPGKGIRILSIDGGGVRGILVLEMLRKLEELTGKRVHEMFDFICGVSTGAIVACSLGILMKDLDELQRNYKELSTKIFTQSAIWGTSSLVWSHSYYDTALWEKLLKEQFNDKILIKSAKPNSPKCATLSAVVNQSRCSAYIFRNYELPYRVHSEYMGSNKHYVWEAVRASAAAPTYFEEFKLGNHLHQDGGILYNNPTAVAIHEAKLIWPESPIQCVVSFGTGRTVPIHESSTEEPKSNNSSWKNKFLKILDSATDTEGVHTVLSDLLPNDVYYRFNPYLTEMLSMVEINPEKLDQLERDALMYLRRNEDKFQQAAQALLEKKTPSQAAYDWFNHQKNVLGFNVKI